MPCDLPENKLEAYVLGLLGEQETQQVRQHMQTCGECRQKAAKLQNAASLIGRGFDQAPPPYMRSKVLAHLKDRPQPKSNWLAWATPALVGAAFVVLVIKIDPGRMLKQQALAPVEKEQTRAAAAPVLVAEKPAASMPKSKGPQARTASKKMRIISAPAAQPAGLIQEDREKQESQVNFSNRALEETSQAPGREAAADFKAKAAVGKDKRSLAKREVEKEELGGGVQPMSAVAPAPAAMQSLHQSVDLEETASRAPEAETRIVPKGLECTVALAGIEGGLDPVQVKPVAGRFAQQTRARVLQQGNAGTFFIRVTLDAQGRVLTADFDNGAFDSTDLDQFILSEIHALQFPHSAEAAAAVIFKIEVR